MAERSGEDLRQILDRLMRKHTSVRFADAVPAELACRPVFIVSAARSGSTLLRLIFDSHSNICCPPEGNFIGLLAPLLSNPFAVAGMKYMGFSTDHVAARLRELVAYFYENYARSCDKPRWADKSSGMPYHCEFARRLFPEAQFIMLLRHPLDMAESMVLLKEAELSLQPFLDNDRNLFVAAARMWQDIVTPSIRFAAAHPDICHTIRYEQLCADPAAVLKPMFEFIGEPWEPAVMDVHNRPHDLGVGDLKVYRWDQIRPNSNKYRHRPADELERARAAAEPLMSQLGYEV